MRTRVCVHVCFLPESYLLRIVKESRSHVLLRDWQPVQETGEEVRVEGSKASLVPSLPSSFLLVLRGEETNGVPGAVFQRLEERLLPANELWQVTGEKVSISSRHTEQGERGQVGKGRGDGIGREGKGRGDRKGRGEGAGREGKGRGDRKGREGERGQVGKGRGEGIGREGKGRGGR